MTDLGFNGLPLLENATISRHRSDSIIHSTFISRLWMVWQWSRGPQLYIFIFIFFGLVRLDNPFPFSCSGWPARHLDEAFPFGVSQTRSSLCAFYPPTQLDTTQRDHAGSLAFPSGIELFEKSHSGSDGHLQLCIFTNCTVSSSSLSLAFFKIQSRQEARHIAFQQWQSWNTLFRFPQNKSISLYCDHKTHFGI